MIFWWSSTRDRQRRILSLLSCGVFRFWWLDRFCSIGGRCGSAGFAVTVSFAFLLRCLLVLCLDFALFSGTQGDSLSCIGDTPFTHSDICSCKLVEVTGTHFPSLGFWSSLLMSRMAVKRLLFSSRSELASCFKMVWWDSNSCNLSWRSLFSFCSDMTSSFA